MAKKDKDKPAEEAEEAKDKPAEGAEGEGAEDADAAKKAKKKKIIIIAAAVVVLLLAGIGGAFFAGVFGGGSAEGEHAEEDKKEVAKAVFYTLPEFLVNLNSASKQTSFLKTTIILELVSEEDVPLVEASLPRLLDAFNTYLRELRPSDLSGSAGIQRLREELLLRANKALAPLKITDVLFKEIIVQ